MQTLSRPLRRWLAVAALAVAAPVVTGCGFDVQTDQIYQPAEGVNARAQGIDVLGAVVVSATDGSGRLIATFVDKQETSGDALRGITGKNVTVSDPGIVQIPSNSVGFANLADQKFTPIIVTGKGVDAGRYVTLRFTFAGSEPVTTQVPVVDTSGTYAGLAPGQQDTGSSSAAGDSVAAQGSQGAVSDGSASADEEGDATTGTAGGAGQ